MYKISGTWNQGDLDTSIDQSTKMHKYYVVKVDELLKPISKHMQSNVREEIDFATICKFSNLM